MDPWVGLAIGLVLVAVNGFFVAAEFALVKLRPTQIAPRVEQGELRARLADAMLKNLDAYLSACQLGITLASLGLGWIGEPAFAWLLEPLFRHIPGASPALLHSVSLTVAFVTITALHIVLGEQAPKSLAIRKSEATGLLASLPLWLFYKLTFPIIWVLNQASNGLLKLLGIRPVDEHGGGTSEDELRRMVSSRGAVQLPRLKRELLDNVFELSHRTARQVMTPRSDVVFLTTGTPLATSLETARKSGHTRYPVCEGDLDHVVGVVHIKDLFRRTEPIESLGQVMRQIQFVPEATTLDRVLRRMTQERLHMMAVVDEYGGVAGLVTLENVIEEIVGQIQDEFDEEKPELVRQGDRVFLVSGEMLVADLEHELAMEISDRDADTISGVVLTALGRDPHVGDSVRVGPITLEVLEVRRRRCGQLRVTLSPETIPPPRSIA
jgi:CBS domain containing-hemolysin-like protein